MAENSFQHQFISGFKTGNYEAFCLVYALQFNPVRQVAIEFTCDDRLADIVTLDSFSALITRRMSLVGYRQIFPFLYRTARNRSLLAMHLFGTTDLLPGTNFLEDVFSTDIHEAARDVEVEFDTPLNTIKAALETNVASSPALLDCCSLVLDRFPSEPDLENSLSLLVDELRNLRPDAGAITLLYFIEGLHAVEFWKQTGLPLDKVTRQKMDAIRILEKRFEAREIFLSLLYATWIKVP